MSMENSRPTRRPRRMREARSLGLSLVGTPPLRNPLKPLELLSQDQLMAIHEASLYLLENIGIEFMGAAARDKFRKAGATVDDATGLVKIPREVVERALKTAPSSFLLCPRNPARQINAGGNHISFGLVAGPPNVHDCINGRRNGNLGDYIKLIKLAQSFDIIHFVGNQPTAPIELPAHNRHLDCYLANITYADKVFHCSAIGRERAVDGIAMMALSRGKTLEQVLNDPCAITIISVNSPRRFDEMMAEGLMTMAEFGQSVAVTPFTLMGAMSPVTLAGALAQQNAEALFGVVLTQLVRPGAPVMYGAFTSNVDMRSGAPAFGTPENTKANIASGQLARRYSLPYRTTPGSASNAADAQGAYETLMALWGAVLGHGNLVYHAAGWQEGGLTASFEKLIIDVEMIQHMMEFLRPIVVDEAELAVEALGAVPTGGHFFGEPHTLERYATAFYQPMLSNWQNYEAWQEAGGLDTTARATRLWKKALEDYVEPVMDIAVREALEAYVARRKEAIGQGEP